MTFGDRSPTPAPRWHWLLPALALLAAVASIVAHADSSRGLTHTVGVFVVLAELLREGVLYPAAPSFDLVYTTFYHPLAFAPYALLPGEGLDLAPGMRLLVGGELLVALLLLGVLAGRGLRLLPAAVTLCTVAGAFSLLGMRDDPRALLLAVLALVAFGGRTRDARPRPVVAGILLGAAFFAKATTPLAPGAALVLAAVLRRPEQRPWRIAATLVVTSLVTVAAGVLFLQVGLGCDFLGQGMHWAVVEPARPGRSWAEALAALGTDLWREQATPVLLVLSAVTLGWRAVRHALDRYDALVLLVAAKTVVTYRSWGTDLNHLLDLSAFAALQVLRSSAPILTTRPWAAPLLLLAMLGLGRPWTTLWPDHSYPSIEHSELAQLAAHKDQFPFANQPTLCEEPLLAWLLERKPLCTDPFQTFAALRQHPDIRARWFGPTDHPAALRCLVLMHDPQSDDPQRRAAADHWYRHLHFDPEFADEVRRNWRRVGGSDRAWLFTR